MMSNVGKVEQAEQGPGRAADGPAGSPDGGQHEAEVVGQGAWRVEGEGKGQDVRGNILHGGSFLCCQSLESNCGHIAAEQMGRILE